MHCDMQMQNIMCICMMMLLNEYPRVTGLGAPPLREWNAAGAERRACVSLTADEQKEARQPEAKDKVPVYRYPTWMTGWSLPCDQRPIVVATTSRIGANSLIHVC